MNGYYSYSTIENEKTVTTTTSWSVKQIAGTDAGVYVQNATFDFKNKDPLEDQKPVFTKINTENTATTDFKVVKD